jgi:hypothetical protein
MKANQVVWKILYENLVARKFFLTIWCTRLRKGWEPLI